MKNEKTSKSNASIAARIMGKIGTYALPKSKIVAVSLFGEPVRLCTVGELQSAMASLLTQAPDRKKAMKGSVK